MSRHGGDTPRPRLLAGRLAAAELLFCRSLKQKIVKQAHFQANAVFSGRLGRTSSCRHFDQVCQNCLQGRQTVVSTSLKPITHGFSSQLADAVGPLQLGLPNCEMELESARTHHPRLSCGLMLISEEE
ncbi:uncharacterized protein LOC144246942 [Lonchura striata]